MTTWATLADLNKTEPCKDYGAVLDTLEADYNSTENLPCWQTEAVPVDEVDRYQIIDDPDDEDGRQKVELLREALRRSAPLPPIVVVHGPTSERGTYDLLDGRHRFNAAHEERLSSLSAWVAHIGCCDGPSPDPAST
ncbi:ParB/RepB/Spo0J family partition protein [Streptomyces sp. NPDC056707]|uniref:ParB/RepB/Spo0J family partition protein n=1 Tax=Streptomyces sp. NPDC056707 TaxID=3345919 RepID=UPI00367AFE23